jgi:23S rRNA pseudouridine1911/1915/1917 synthase
MPKMPAKKSVKKVVKKAAKKVVKKAIKKTAAKKATAGPKHTSAKTVAKKAVKKVVKTAVKVVKKAAKTPVVKKTARKTAPTPPKKTEAKPTHISVLVPDAGKRIDSFLSEKLDNASRTRIQKWMSEGAVYLNGEQVLKSRLLEPGDEIKLIQPEEVTLGRAEPENIPLEIVYEDKYLVVVNKPKGLVTHPGHGVPGGTLANALLYHYKTLSDFGGTDRPGIVHRLDRDTSGLLVAARDNATHAALSTMLADRKIHRTYQALVWREPPPEGTFDAPLGRHAKDPVKRAVVVPTHRSVPGKAAVTHYRVLDWYQFAAHVEVTLETGRTHQIRVHFSHAGFPIAGDTLYGGGDQMLGRVPPLFQQAAHGLLKRLHSQALHAVKLSFTHPRTKKALSFESPLPQEFRDSLKLLEKFKREEEDEN